MTEEAEQTLETEGGPVDDKIGSLSELKTPCFVIDTKKFCDQIKAFRESLDSCFKSNILAYSVKTNSLPYILNLVRTQDMYADIPTPMINLEGRVDHADN